MIRESGSPAGEPDSGPDWRRAATAQHNMLLEGTEASLAAVVLLPPYLREPVPGSRIRETSWPRDTVEAVDSARSIA